MDAAWQGGLVISVLVVCDSVEIRAAPEKVFSVLQNLELLLRLNAGWEITRAEKPERQLRAGDVLTFTLKQKSTDCEVAAEVLELIENQKISLRYSPGRHIAANSFTLRKTLAGTELYHEANITRSENPEEELKQWQNAIKFRAELGAKRNPLSVASRYFIDKIFLKLRPSHRRIALHIILLNFFLLLMAVGLVIVIILSHRYLGL